MVVTLDRALLDTQQAFDGVASTYDRSNAANPTLCDMRARVRCAIEAQLAPGSSLLDLGCGPGCDAQYFASVGHRVTAIDWSPAMVDAARRRMRAAGLSGVDVQHVGIHEVERVTPAGAHYDAVYSNFGPLNCVVDLERVAHAIAARLRPEGVLVASVIGRVCPWEMAVHLARGRVARALVRFRRGLVPVPLEGRTVWTRYYTPSEFETVFAAAGLVPVSVRALGVLVPPPYLLAFAERHPSLMSALQRAEDSVAGWPLVRQCGDHFLVVMRKRS